MGLGNLWRFPYIAGENGGGAIVLIYIGFVIVIGLPLVGTTRSVKRFRRQWRNHFARRRSDPGPGRGRRRPARQRYRAR